MPFKNIKISKDYGYVDGQFSSKVATIDSMVIDQEKRCQGFGTELYNQFEQEAKQFGVEIVCLDVFQYNVRAISFWQKMGFIIDGVDNQDFLECHKNI